MAPSPRFSHNHYRSAAALAFSALLLAGCGQQNVADKAPGAESEQAAQRARQRDRLGRQGKNPSLTSNTKISPYLEAHQDDLVSWAPWGQDAFELAQAENKPVLLSIGFSACHWCHVM
ncbi:MAG: uncharacterized protein QG574_4928, partial [Cyanobacteriota bacterium erpe_2018_sw_21hr_WHONDRS-SW48-000092_B_bin.40]|nr:uncharacterized protein [Cyanobacteriota bacterium erpe_2018_sw_21hr_WHONDRS-SW48-000092_B_bin.40]